MNRNTLKTSRNIDATHGRAEAPAKLRVETPMRTRLVIEIADDGIGGAQPADGSGLAGLADRVAACGGTLTVTGPVGHGTRVIAELPTERRDDDPVPA
jgi:signal transduction histidine kinase